jgi:hypothetical protein
MKIRGRQRHKSLIVNYQHEQLGIDFDPGGAGPYRVVCMAGLNFGQLWDKKRGYKNFFKKSVDGFFWMDRFSLPLISGLKIYLDLWGKSEFFDNGVFFCLVTDKGIRSTAVLF